LIDAARRHADQMGLSKVEFREGLIELLLIESESIDLLIFNVVLNSSWTSAAITTRSSVCGMEPRSDVNGGQASRLDYEGIDG
jgi:hypothetical protein